MIDELNIKRKFIISFYLIAQSVIFLLYSSAKKTLSLNQKFIIKCDLQEKGNNYEIIARAFSKIKGQNNCKIVFPSGTYNLASEVETTHLFAIDGISNFEIEGNNTHFIIDEPDKGFIKFKNCSNGLIRGISIDYSTLPYTQGEIILVSRDSLSFVFNIDETYKSPLSRNFEKSKTKWGILFDKKNQTLKDSALNLIQAKSIIPLSETKFKVYTMPHAISSVGMGDSFAIIARYNGRSTYAVDQCVNILFSDNVHYAGPAGSFGLRESSGIQIERCNVIRKSGRLISQNADCVHVTPGKRGPEIRGCIFEGQMDDAINIKTQLLYIDSIINKYECLLSGVVNKGDTLDLFDPRTGNLIDSLIVLSVQKNGGKTRAKFEKSLPEIQTGRGKDKDMFFNRSMSNQGFVIQNNIFRSSRRYGMLIQASNGVIENNLFENISTAAIVLQNSANWPEGFVPKRVLIKNNTIRNCGFDKNYWNEVNQVAPIVIRTTTCHKNIAKWQGVECIRLINNDVSSNGKYDIYLSGTKNILLLNNRLTGPELKSVFIENCSNVNLQP